MELQENKVVTRKRLEELKQIVEREAQIKKENPSFVEATKLILLEIAEAMTRGLGRDLPKWTMQWDLGHQPLRFFALSQDRGHLSVHLEKYPSDPISEFPIQNGGWVEIENLKVEQCWKINEYLNEVGAPEIKLLK